MLEGGSGRLEVSMNHISKLCFQMMEIPKFAKN
jgi:hypothetical protein